MENENKSILADELNALISANKTIIPFKKEYFSCQALSDVDNLVYLDLTNYSAIEKYSAQDQVITVQTGMKIKSLQEFLLEEKKWFPVNYYDSETSLLDLILSAEAGPTESLFDGLSKHILGLESVLGTGQTVHSGGRVVKNVAGYDLTRFFIGSYGYFALPIKAHIRLYSIPSHYLTFLIQDNDWRQLLKITEQLCHSGLPLTYIDFLNQKSVTISNLKDKYRVDKQFLLLAQTYGYDGTIDESINTLKKNLSENKILFSTIANPDDQNCLLEELSQLSWFTNKETISRGKKSRIIDLSISPTNICELLNEESISSFPFIYRKASNRIRFCVNSILEQSALLNHLENFARLKKTSFTVGYGDDSYIRRVSKLGYDTSNGGPLGTIKKQLKMQFDPHNLFNPYVDL